MFSDLWENGEDIESENVAEDAGDSHPPIGPIRPAAPVAQRRVGNRSGESHTEVGRLRMSNAKLARKVE